MGAGNHEGAADHWRSSPDAGTALEITQHQWSARTGYGQDDTQAGILPFSQDLHHGLLRVVV